MKCLIIFIKTKNIPEIFPLIIFQTLNQYSQYEIWNPNPLIASGDAFFADILLFRKSPQNNAYTKTWS